MSVPEPVHLSLDDPAFSKVAPFHVVWDSEGTVIRLSDAVTRYWFGPELPQPVPPVELLEPYPCQLNKALLGELTRMTLHVGVSSAPGRSLKGGDYSPVRRGGWTFGIPPLENIRSLELAGITLRDLPLHMGVTDFLLANEALQASLSLNHRRKTRIWRRRTGSRETRVWNWSVVRPSWHKRSRSIKR